MFDSFVTSWAVARQAPLSIAFPKLEYWSGLPFPSPGDISDPKIKPASPTLQVDSLPVHTCMLSCFGSVQVFVTLWTVA